MDRYQGRDKSLIILSFVRSTAEEGTVSVSLPHLTYPNSSFSSLCVLTSEFSAASPFVVRRAVEGLASPECGHHPGQTQAADGGLSHDAPTLRACGETTQPSPAREHDILSVHVYTWCYH